MPASDLPSTRMPEEQDSTIWRAKHADKTESFFFVSALFARFAGGRLVSIAVLFVVKT